MHHYLCTRCKSTERSLLPHLTTLRSSETGKYLSEMPISIYRCESTFLADEVTISSQHHAPPYQNPARGDAHHHGMWHIYDEDDDNVSLLQSKYYAAGKRAPAAPGEYACCSHEILSVSYVRLLHGVVTPHQVIGKTNRTRKKKKKRI